MIEISHHNNEIAIKGHAGYAPHGQDIVCASISTLTQVFIESVGQLTTDKLKCEIRAGNAVISYKNLSEKSRTLMDSFFVGVNMIANAYPHHVRIV